MEWTKDDREALLAFKDAIDCDDIRVKEIIKQVLLNNRFIIHVLANEELEAAEAEPDDYFGENIFPYYIMPDTQSSNKSFICYEVKYDELERYNDSVKVLQIVFYILCDHSSSDWAIDKDTNLAKHDLLAALIIDQFNLSTYFGSRIKLISDIPSTTDSDYTTRTLIFQQTTDNNLVKSNLRKVQTVPSNVARLSNKDVQAPIG